jgi:KipI family sensor histidine kinase inhibitor
MDGMPTPILMPLGDRALLVRFADTLSDAANRAAIALARQLDADTPEGVEEIAPGLVSVLLRTRPGADLARLRGEVMLRMGEVDGAAASVRHTIEIAFDGEDLAEVSGMLNVTPDEFIASHNELPVRVLATGFAPGFVYCGFHDRHMVVPRRETVRPMVTAGTVLFAAGQTAIAATPIRTGWHIIGRTAFQNFDPACDPPTTLQPGDIVQFAAVQ